MEIFGRCSRCRPDDESLRSPRTSRTAKPGVHTSVRIVRCVPCAASMPHDLDQPLRRTSDFILPTGGWGRSGFGKDLGRQAVEANLRFKTVLMDFSAS